jgi:type II secretory pathway pseudopilin PulG
MKLTTRSHKRAFTLVEMGISTSIFSVVGLTLCSLVNTTTILGAKNTALNTAHQQARTAMVQMLQDLHSSVSLPSLVDANGNTVSGAGPAAGIAFQQWSSGPHKIKFDASTTQNQITVTLTPNGGPVPVAGQRLIVPTHQIEDDITAVSGSGTDRTITLAHNLPVAVSGTDTYSIVCFITDRCSYTINSGNLEWRGPTTKKSFAVLNSDITSSTPFSTPLTTAGALYYRFTSAIDLSTADPAYSNRNFKSANIFLNAQVPMKARLVTYQ